LTTNVPRTSKTLSRSTRSSSSVFLLKNTVSTRLQARYSALLRIISLSVLCTVHSKFPLTEWDRLLASDDVDPQPPSFLSHSSFVLGSCLPFRSITTSIALLLRPWALKSLRTLQPTLAPLWRTRQGGLVHRSFTGALPLLEVLLHTTPSTNVMFSRSISSRKNCFPTFSREDYLRTNCRRHAPSVATPGDQTLLHSTNLSPSVHPFSMPSLKVADILRPCCPPSSNT
jgi:hypothetical protein